jgi:hypothetical protein
MESLTGEGKTVNSRSKIFNELIADILRFFGDHTVSFDVAQTLEAMKIRDAVLASRNNCGQWIEF